MSSLLPGFEYDIFISYRQNDNRSGWVTEFVKALEEELSATIKEPISIYFDKNPHDGLLETHSVDKSLEGKLKCLIFIPIISQTYCDPKSFAWQQEFCAFLKMAKEDQVGLEVKLGNGNVTSRILPIKIHELDEEDKILLENELGTALRTIEFIYQEPGVNRPLKPTDNKNDNQDKTDYRNQVNKLANAVKGIINSLKHKPIDNRADLKIQQPGKPSRKRFTNVSLLIILMVVIGYFSVPKIIRAWGPKPSGNIIAIVPFENLSTDSTQEYLCRGLTEDIRTQLAKGTRLSVSAVFSNLPPRFPSSELVETAEKFKVSAILTGSLRVVGEHMTIHVHLIDVATKTEIWSEKYESELNDIRRVQSELAIEIAGALRTNYSDKMAEVENLQTGSVEAYKLVLKSRYNYYKGEKAGFQNALQFSEQAIKLDPNFSQAYAQLSNIYANIFYYGYDDILDTQTAKIKAKEAAVKAVQLDPNNADAHEALGFVQRTIDWDWKGAESEYKTAISLNPGQFNTHIRYGLLLAALGRFEEAQFQGNKAMELDPLASVSAAACARINYFAGRFDKVVEITDATFSLEPGHRPSYGIRGCALEQLGQLDSSVVLMIKAHTRTGTDYEGLREIYSMDRAPYREYWKSVLKQTIKPNQAGIPHLAMAILYLRNNRDDEAMKELMRAYEGHEGGMVYVNVEPLFNPLRNNPQFQSIIRAMRLETTEIR